MERNQEKRFLCKFCNRKFPCGKSLGGHIRTHVNENSAGANEEAERSTLSKLLSCARNSKRASVPETACGEFGYGLRENPTKTKRFVDSSSGSLLKSMFCKECGKGFQSMKALCGHMACHSEKERGTNRFEDHSHGSEKQKVMMDSESDTETPAPSRRRSKRIRYKAIGNVESDSISLVNVSSSVSEIEHEQEEVAMCLMMLSRDSNCRNSDYNSSVVLEVKSPSSMDLRVTIKNGMKRIFNGDEVLELKEPGGSKLESGFSSENSSSDSGCSRNGTKKIESDVPVNGFLKNVGVETGSGFAKLGKSSSKLKRIETEFGKDNGADGAYKYECLTCSKTFDSLKALGGHRASHKKISDCYKSKFESGEDRLKTCLSSGNAEKRLGLNKRSKGHTHKCPFCFRVFKSAQALGGHKRTHFSGGSEEKTVVMPPEMTLPCLIDLNLPAPVEEDTMGKC